MRIVRRVISKALWNIYPKPNVVQGSPFSDWRSCHAACANATTYQEAGFVARLAVEVVSADLTMRDAYQFAGIIGLGIGLISGEGRRLRVLDFGGGAGIHYVDARKALGDRFEWTVVEAEVTASGARKAGIRDITFSDNLAAFANSAPDICLMSGSIQYCEDPGAVVKALDALKARCYIMRRTPVLSEEQEATFSGKYWVQRARYFHLFHGDVISTRRTAYPLRFLENDMLSPLDAGRERRFDATMGTLYKANGHAIGGRTIVWV